ncbi:NAD(P)/FAD-dependent oxidoreductase [Maribacter thermophilus]|uniref:NAD(P)/FAD-dependent oxidoreductase n=1 Tax=Maribacter thermophilus TaxID=1197874 RepID=UPI0006413585|nr:FAD-dependent oxidoreductase [Maribacter thermophilus]
MGKKIVVVGGGVIGLCSAYYLHKNGHEVTVLEKTKGGMGASFVNAGYLTPSHIIPLAAPGVITKGLSMMMDSKSPFYIKPRWDFDFFKWAWSFYTSSTKEKVVKAAPVLKDINLLSSGLYDEIRNSGDLGEFHLEKKGLLMLYQTEVSEEEEKGVANKAKQLGLEVGTLDKDQLKALHGNTEVVANGAVHYHCDAHSTPNVFMKKMYEYLKHAGVNIIYEEEVDGFDITDGKINAVRTKNHTYKADNVVLASGSWSGNLAKKLGINLQVQGGKGYCINVHRPTGIEYPAILMEAKVAVTPMDGFTRFAGTMEFSGVDYKIDKGRVQAIADAVHKYYPQIRITEEEINNAECGLRPVSPDGLPYIGRSNSLNNLYVATGHAMMGWSLGPATGKLISEIVDDKETSMNIDAFDPHRSFK